MRARAGDHPAQRRDGTHYDQRPNPASGCPVEGVRSRKQPLKSFFRECLAEHPTLKLVTLQLPEDVQLNSGLYALSDHSVTMAVGHLDDPPDRARIAGLPFDARDERAVNLQPPDREPLRVAWQGMAGAEIVDGDSDPHACEVAEHRGGDVEVLPGGAFTNL